MAIVSYTAYISDISELTAIASTNVDLLAALPMVIDDAEQRLYRELDLLNTRTTDDTGSLTAGSKNFTLPSTNGTFLVLERVNVVTPAGATTGNGTLNPLLPVSKETIDYLWPSVNGSGIPTLFSPRTQTDITVGPYPDQSYNIEIFGTIRPAPLSSTNITTLLTAYFPDLFMAASMVFMAGYMKNYGAAADDPGQAGSWESHYQKLLQSAAVEEARKKFSMQGWSSKQPSPATPPRT
jgi:hypothetical protein